MAARNTLISWNNLDHNPVGTYDSNETQSSSLYLYLSACSFQVTISCTSKGSAVSCRATLYWYDWKAQSWKEAGYISTSALSSGTRQAVFNHNYQGLNSDADNSTHHLWKVVFSSVTRLSSTARIQITYGNAGYLTEEQYNSLCKGKPIVSAGNLNGPCLITSETESDSNALELFDYRKDRGTVISASFEHKLIPLSWE